MKHSVADFDRLVAEQSKTVPLQKFIMTAQEFLSTRFPPIKLIVQPWLEDCGLTMIHSAPGVGKTLFLLGMSVAITRRKPPRDFCDWKIKCGVGVLYVDAEMPSPHMQKRLAELEAAYPNNPESKKNKLWLLSGAHLSRCTGKAINLSDEYWRDLLFNIIADHPAKVIILDNIVSLISMKDENDAGAWSVINQWLLRLRAMGKSIIFVHHSSKKNKQRGTSHRSDNLDTILRLDRIGQDGFTVSFEKHRNFHGAETKPVNINFKNDKNSVLFTRQESDKAEQKDRNLEIWKMHKAGTSHKDIAKKYGISEGRISQIVLKMKQHKNKKTNHK
jgi:putative DNA primase/helicase